MSDPEILLCGATGELGGAVARRLHARGLPFRALVRPGADTSSLAALGALIVRGDVRDRASLAPAVSGITVVVTTVNAIGRLLGGARDLSIRDVDERGNANLIDAAEAGGVERFVFVSMLGDHAATRTPFTDAKAATEARLRASRMREVIVRPDAFQEVWLGPAGGFNLAGGTSGYSARVSPVGGTSRSRMWQRRLCAWRWRATLRGRSTSRGRKRSPRRRSSSSSSASSAGRSGRPTSRAWR